ncbi:hypothetical protein H6G11_12540 [Cyanobacterium aponinum FACHB-4101]|uniref:hypothetical protein n=1 Tax=Cyanobacterium aponinum TaxID=379064 RepID=UPI0016800DE5|nr:hypothetical protein [Cyanobacterium aponinum]MBD2395075.1 hypothetical protein [Cyanobacterium aponinum FACHB-4101]
MSIKVTFRSFTAATFVLEQIARTSTDTRITNYEIKTITTEINVDHAIIAIPAQVAFLAFSIELGLKMLLIKSKTIQEPRGHNLKDLFNKLPQDIKTTIRQNVINSMKTLDYAKFEEVLESNSSNFEKWRYFHESSNLSCDKEFLGHLLVSIHNYTVEKKY